MRRGTVSFLIIVALLLICIQINAQTTWTYDFESNVTTPTETVVQTVNDITLTASQSGGIVLLLPFGGASGTSGNIIYCDSNIGQLILSFNETVNVLSIHIAEGASKTDQWDITSDQGNSMTGVSTNDAGTSGNTVTLQWASVNEIYITDPSPSSSSNHNQFVVDNIVLHSSSTFPVELTDFTASIIEAGVQLVWHTATEVNNYGFDIERSVVTGRDLSLPTSWENIGFMPGHGNSNSPKSYEFTDENPPGGKIEYRLKQIDTDGSFEYYSTTADIYYSITGVKDHEQVEQFMVLRNYPNPFNPVTTIEYKVPSINLSDQTAENSTRQVLLKVYDTLGREVSTLVNSGLVPGKYKTEFIGSNLPSGMYFCTLSVNGISKIRKMLLLR